VTKRGAALKSGIPAASEAPSRTHLSFSFAGWQTNSRCGQPPAAATPRASRFQGVTTRAWLHPERTLLLHAQSQLEELPLPLFGRGVPTGLTVPCKSKLTAPGRASAVQRLLSSGSEKGFVCVSEQIASLGRGFFRHVRCP